MLESRNERMYVMVLAYIIGFTTAYIAFGVTNQLPIATIVEKPVSVVTDDAVVLLASVNGLEFIKDGERTLLSASETLLDEPPTTYTPGVHKLVVTYELSPDASSVYFCEVPSTDESYCVPYVYHISEDIVSAVKVAGETLELPPEPHSVEWGSDGLMKVAGISVSG